MSESLHRTKQDIEAIAAEKGLICIFPQPEELTLDIDEGMDVRLNVLAALATNKITVRSELITTSQNGNAHVYLWMDRGFSQSDQVAIQACLGSDPVKEVLSIMRMQQDSDYPTAMFETPTEAAKVDRWRIDRTKSNVHSFDDDDIPF